MGQNVWIFTFWGRDIILFPYMLMNALALIVGLQLLDYYLQKDMSEKQNMAYTLFVISTVIGWFGAHLLDCLVRDLPFQKAGFIFYGGLISSGIFYCASASSFLTRKEFFLSLHAAVIPVVVAHAIGRIGCFFGDCCFGSEIHADSLLHELFQRHPTQLYEAAILIALVCLFSWLRSNSRMNLALVYLATYPVCRFFLEFLRGDDRGVFLSLSTSQWISIFLLLLFLIVVLKNYLFFPATFLHSLENTENHIRSSRKKYLQKKSSACVLPS
ncbi:hypothetical protein C4565_10045 [Candidatus Parcubacteria bacterium]|nr:MAG: hypothetical protein C4565_10045 [Candidatus Parcubacteria bacterium]